MNTFRPPTLIEESKGHVSEYNEIKITSDKYWLINSWVVVIGNECQWLLCLGEMEGLHVQWD